MSFEAVVLAGGKGTRLAPFTHVLPKPLLPVGERPILDLVLTQLAAAGCSRVTLAVGHLGHIIEIYCGDGERWGLTLEYLRETTPLGTVGALARIDDLPEDGFVVMNGDVLSNVSYERLLASHAQGGAELTIASFRRCVRDELGVIEVDDSSNVVAYREKPEHEYLVSMGIYAMNGSVVDLVPRDGPLDLPDLVDRLLQKQRRVSTYVHSDYWLDLGRPDDFQRANDEFEANRVRLGLA